MFAYTWSSMISGLRSHSFQLLAGLAVVILVIAWLAASFSARQPMTLAMDIGISGLRLSVILMALFWVQDLLVKDIEHKSVLFVLAYPVPRSSFVLGRYAGIALLTAVAVIAVGALLAGLVLLKPSAYAQSMPVRLGLPFIAMLFYQYLAILVVAAFALMLATLSTTPMLPLLGGIGFAIIAGSIGPTIDFLNTSRYADPTQVTALGPTLTSLLYAIPDLSRLDIRAWSLYGQRPDTAVLVGGPVMAIGYILLLLGVAVNRFQRREFV